MGKRSDFERIEKDAYMTIDARAVVPLHKYISDCTYYEPCYGNGSLAKLLKYQLVGFSDIEQDARTTKYDIGAEYFITNPPWSRDMLHSIIENLRNQLPTWLLFDADWMHTKQAIPHIKYCKTIISVGRLRWIPESKYDGKENCAWYLFVKEQTQCEFISRTLTEPMFNDIHGA